MTHKPQDETVDIAANVPGMPPNFGQFLLPHIHTFAGVSSSIAKTYRPTDEAMRDSWENAAYMRNDPSIMECVEARQRACALLNWHIEPEDSKNQQQKEIASHLTNLIKKIPYFTKYREALLNAVWWGKYAVQHRWGIQSVRRTQYRIPVRWLPIDGDKIVFSWDKHNRIYDDDRIGIRVGSQFSVGESLGNGLIVEQYKTTSQYHVETTDQGLAYFLQPRHRPLIALHRHAIEDGPHHSPELAGRIHGVGVRSRIYWTWYQKQETLSWLMEYLERSAQGFEVWYYPAGNAAAEKATRTAAEERISTRNIILCPYFPEETQRPPYERIEPSMAGADAMRSIVTDYFGHLMKRLILGQTLTSEQGSTGLGSNLADIHLGTFMQIVKYDAINLEETLTQDLVKPLIRYNFPAWTNYDFLFRIDTEGDDAKEKVDALRTGWEMGLKIKTEDLYELLGASRPTEKDDFVQNPQFAQQQQQQQQQQAPPVDPQAQAAAAAQMQAEFTAALQNVTASPQPVEKFGATAPSENSERVKLRTYAAESDSEPQVISRLKNLVRRAAAGENLRIDVEAIPVSAWDQWARAGYVPGQILGLILLDHDDSVEQYRRRGVKSSPGQKSLFGDDPDFEEKHPRAEDGKFAPKGEGGYNRGKRKRGDDEPEELEDAGNPEPLHAGEPTGEDAPASHGTVPPANAAGNRRGGRTRRVSRSDDGAEHGVRNVAGNGGDGPVSGEGNGAGKPADSSGGGGSAEDSEMGAGGSGGGRSGGSRKSAREAQLTDTSRDHRFEADFIPRGAKSKIRANLDAIKTIKKIEAEGREEATPEEQRTLAKYVGWGAFAQPMFTSYNRDYQNERETFRSLVSDDEYAAASKSTLNAHYTSPKIVDFHWKLAERLGFKGGRYLDPSVGTGFYPGMMPEELKRRTKTTAVELDPTTAKIAKYLHPSAKVKNEGFEKHASPDNFYDLVASNVPFGDYKIYEKRYAKHSAPIHDHFFLKSIDLAKPGGLVMHITSTGTLDKPDSAIRKAMAEKADFVGAVRFPSQTHAENAGTEVVTDLVVLRKRPEGVGPAPADTPADAAPSEQGFTGITTDSLGRVYHWVNGKRVPSDHWLRTTTVKDPLGGDDIEVNQYFANNPQMVLGQLDRSGTMYTGDMKSVSGVTPDDLTNALGRKVVYREGNRGFEYQDSGETVAREDVSRVANELLDQRLQGVISKFPEGIAGNNGRSQDAEGKEPAKIEAVEGLTDGSLHEENGTIYQRQGGEMVALPVSEEAKDRIVAQIAVRDAAKKLIQAQVNGGDSAEARSTLNTVYDAFVAKYGPLNDKANRRAMQDSDDGLFLASLEKWDGKTAAKTPFFEKDTIRSVKHWDKVDSLEQGYAVSLHNHGKVDPEYIAAVSDRDVEDVKDELLEKGLAYDDPNGTGWHSASEYLSGNVRKKLAAAKVAAELDPRYLAHVAALEKNQPEDVTSEDIDARLGASWIPPADVRDFAAEMLGVHPSHIEAAYDKVGAEWHVKPSAHALNGAYAKNRWTVPFTGSAGTVGADFEDIVAHAASNKPLVVGYKDEDGKYIVDQEATETAQAKVQELKEEFRTWLWQDDDRRDRLTSLYNEQCNAIVPQRFDGSHLTFPGLQGKELRPAQADFVWRAISTGRGLAGHEVGTGKTSTMIAAAMELRRLGLAKKPAICCLKSNIEQMTASAQAMYPNARILSTVGKFDEQSRKETIARIATGDYDMVFMTHDHLKMMPVSPETETKFMDKEIARVREALEEAVETYGRGKGRQKNVVVKNLEKRLADTQARYQKLLDTKRDNVTSFEDSGIDTLFVDEAHTFKSLPVTTKMGNIKGVPTGKSQRATDMLMKCHYLLEKNNNRGVFFATGTPVANTMAELYNMQRFLQPDHLEEAGVSNFDAWAAQYTDTETRNEFTVTGDYKPTTRLSRFGNIPELMNLAGQVLDVQKAVDFKDADGNALIKRPKRKDHVIVAPNNDNMQSLMAELAQRAEAAKRSRGQKGADNMLSICTTGRKGAVDLRLWDESLPDNPQSKANLMVNKVLELYHANPGKTQAIFSDMGVHASKSTQSDEDEVDSTRADAESMGASSGGFHLYEDIKKKLIAGGVKEHEIADFSKLEGAKKIQAIADLRSGKKRIAIGSTKRMGTGVNMQNELIALHHLDCPWVPADIEQRDGRGWRQGNKNAEVGIYRYVAEGSLDQTLWQVIDRKSRFITQAMSGDTRKANRSAREEDTEELSPSQLMAAASGDMDVISKIDIEDRVKRLTRAADLHSRQQTKTKKSIEEAVERRSDLGEKISSHRKTASHLAANDRFVFQVGNQRHTERAEADQALSARVNEIEKGWEGKSKWGRDLKELGTYRGLKVYHSPDGRWVLEGADGELHHSGQTLASLEYTARNIPKNVGLMEEHDRRLEEDIARMRASHGKTFPKMAELEAARAELASMDKKIRTKKKQGEKAVSIEKFQKLKDGMVEEVLRGLAIPADAVHYQQPAGQQHHDGVFTDSMGRKYRIQGGKRVPMGNSEPAAPAAPAKAPAAAAAPAKPAAPPAPPAKTPPSPYEPNEHGQHLVKTGGDREGVEGHVMHGGKKVGGFSYDYDSSTYFADGGKTFNSLSELHDHYKANPSHDIAEHYRAIERGGYYPANHAGHDTQTRHKKPDGSYTHQRQELHQQILGHLMSSVQTGNSAPEIHFMGGGPASGKSTVINSGQVQLPPSPAMIDPDEIKGQIPEYQAGNRAKDPKAAAYAHEESSDIAGMVRDTAMGAKAHVVVDGTGDSGYDKMAKKVNDAKAKGYRAVAHYVTVGTDEAVRRAMARAEETGRMVPEDVIRGTHKVVSQIVPRAIQEGLFDEISVYDTETQDGQPPVKIASAQGKNLTVHDHERWNKFLAKGKE